LKKRGAKWSVQWRREGKPKIKVLGIDDEKAAKRILAKVETALRKLKHGHFPKASRVLGQGITTSSISSSPMRKLRSSSMRPWSSGSLPTQAKLDLVLGLAVQCFAPDTTERLAGLVRRFTKHRTSDLRDVRESELHGLISAIRSSLGSGTGCNMSRI